MAVTVVVAASWWVDFELVPVTTSDVTFLPFYLLLVAARVVLGLALCGAGFGIGMGSAASGITCFRIISKNRPTQTWPRFLRTCYATIAALTVFVFTYGFGSICLGDSGFLADSVLFAWLQVGGFFAYRRIQRWRSASEKGAVVDDHT